MKCNLNRRLLLIALGLMGLVQIYAQEKFTSILDSLSVKGKDISITVKEVKGEKYFDLLSRNESFRLQKDSVDFDVIFVNSYRNYSAYMIVGHDEMSDLDTDVGYFKRITSLIFDKENMFA